jgi:hypothetical protein
LPDPEEQRALISTPPSADPKVQTAADAGALAPTVNVKLAKTATSKNKILCFTCELPRVE